MIEEQYKDIEVLYIDDVGDNELWSKRSYFRILGSFGFNIMLCC